MFALALTSLLTLAHPVPQPLYVARSHEASVAPSEAPSVAPLGAATVAPSQAAAKASAAETAPTALPIRPDAVVIRNSGSTNTLGYTITVSPDGGALVAQNGAAVQKNLSASQTGELFDDVRALMPLNGSPTRPCMRSVSFGSSTTVSYENSTTSDLACRSDAASAQLRRAIAAIVRDLDVGILPRQRMQE